MKNATDWLQKAREYKEGWLRRSSHPEMPPVVAAERGGRLLAIACAPQCDKALGIMAAATLRRCADADHLILIVDTFVTTLQHEHAPLASGELQRRWESGERGTISEAMFCLSATSKRIKGASVRFMRLGSLIEWSEPILMDNPGGHLAEVLTSIMAMPPLADEGIVAASAVHLGFDRERSLFHAGRAGLICLRGSGYHVDDRITATHPEWLSDPVSPVI